MIAFDTIDFCVFGIPAYFFCAFCGFVITTCIYIMLMSSKKYDISQSMKILFISLGGMALGAKIFGYLTVIYRNIGLGKTITIDCLFDTGIVFYGGLLGLIVTYFFCLKTKHCILDVQAIDVLAVCIPLFHMIARIGCFLSGCCYGKIYKGMLAVNYTTIIEGRVDVSSRFPVQIVEALFELVVFIYLYLLLQNEAWKLRQLLFQYLTIYSIGRFFLEFLRGDVRRGLIYGISFSQCISVIMWIVLISYCLKKKRFKNIEGGL